MILINNHLTNLIGLGIIRYMSNKFYDIMPASDGSHNLCENGRPIARYSDLATAEKVREEMMMEIRIPSL